MAIGYGAALSMLGIASNAYGEHQGIVGLTRAKTAENREELAYDAQRQKLVGGYVDNMAPVGMAEGAYAADEARVENGAMAPGVAQAGGAALGVAPRSPITAASRAGVRGRSLGRRLSLDEIRRSQLDAGINDVETQRSNSELLYPELERRGALRGQGYRQLGSYLGAGGSALSAYETMNSGSSTKSGQTKYNV